MKYNSNSKSEGHTPSSGNSPDSSGGMSHNHLAKLWQKLVGTTNVQAATSNFYQGILPGEISMSMSAVSVTPERFTQQFERAYLQVMGAWQTMVSRPLLFLDGEFAEVESCEGLVTGMHLKLKWECFGC